MIATAIALTALMFVRSAQAAGRFVTEIGPITRENAADFYFPDSPF